MQLRFITAKRFGSWLFLGRLHHVELGDYLIVDT